MADISGINGASSAAAITNSTNVSKDDFLKLLVTQLQNQDPIKPDSDTAYVAQLAQFATLEQSTNQTKLLASLGGQMAANASSQTVDLVGRTVTARYDHLTLTGNGAPAMSFTLDNPAAKVEMVVKDAGGNVVRRVQSGPLTAGVQSVNWDGRADNGLVLPNGSYQLSVSAVDAAGKLVGVRPEVSGMVTGVSFETGQPELLIGASRALLSDIIEVRR